MSQGHSSVHIIGAPVSDLHYYQAVFFFPTLFSAEGISWFFPPLASSQLLGAKETVLNTFISLNPAVVLFHSFQNSDILNYHPFCVVSLFVITAQSLYLYKVWPLFGPCKRVVTGLHSSALLLKGHTRAFAGLRTEEAPRASY